MFTNEHSSDAYEMMQAQADNLRKEARIKYSISVESAIKSIKKVTGKNKLAFSEINVKFLDGYELKMKKAGCSNTTIGIYLRNLRTAYNEAILKNIIDRSHYPFGKNQFTIPTGNNVKKALDKSDISKLMKYELPPNSEIARGRDYWIFCYLCNGLNIRDIANLKYENIDVTTIKFIRNKTELRKKKKPKTIVIPLTNEIKQIIDHWGNKPQKAKQYIFPILQNDMTPKDIVDRVASTVDFINRNIKAVAKLSGVTQNITTMVARHSWATVLKRAGVSTEYISEGLGHSNMATTENYLGSFEDETLFVNATHLTNF
jgi:integrase